MPIGAAANRDAFPGCQRSCALPPKKSSRDAKKQTLSSTDKHGWANSSHFPSIRAICEIRGFHFVELTQIDNARSVTRNRRIVVRISARSLGIAKVRCRTNSDFGLRNPKSQFPNLPHPAHDRSEACPTDLSLPSRRRASRRWRGCRRSGSPRTGGR